MSDMIAGDWMTAERERSLRAELAEHRVTAPGVVGLRCADFLSRFCGGLHNVRHSSGPYALSKIDWADPWCVEVQIANGLATTDGDALTRIVLLAHALHIRADVSSRGMSRLLLMLHPRQPAGTTGPRSGHPSLDDLAARCLAMKDGAL